MKKVYMCLYCIALAFTCFSQNIEWKLIQDSELYNSNYHFIQKVEAGILLTPRRTSISTELEEKNLPYSYGAGVIFSGARLLVDAEAVIPNRTQNLLDETLLTPFLNTQDKNWFNVNYVEVLKSKKRETFFKYNNKALTVHMNAMKRDEYISVWWEFFNEAGTTNIFQVIITLDNYINGASFYVLDHYCPR